LVSLGTAVLYFASGLYKAVTSKILISCVSMTLIFTETVIIYLWKSLLEAQWMICMIVTHIYYEDMAGLVKDSQLSYTRTQIHSLK
jgi:hypothetical protein